MNPLLQESTKPLEAIDFDTIKVEHFLPALIQAIDEAKKNIEKIKLEKKISFDSIILMLETAADKLDIIVEVFYALHSAHCTQELSDIAEEFNQKLTDYSSDISLDSKLFGKVKQVYAIKKELELNLEQKTVLENTYKSFTRNGALLSESDKKHLREIDQKLAKLSLDFSENTRKATNDYLLVIEKKEDLAGLPEGVITGARETAKEKGHDGKWAFTLDFPSYYPFMQYCENRDLRKEIWFANATKATAEEFDNKQIILDTILARYQRAKLLGYADHPSFVLENRMAKDAKTVTSFIDDIIAKAMPRAKEDFQKLSTLKEELTGDKDFRKYDAPFYTEKLKKKELDFDDEVLRPYFKLENVLEGIFAVAKKLYGISFISREDIPKYHGDVRTYEVQDENGEYLGLFYGDYFPREEKRSGAWMTTLRPAGFQFGANKRPFVCNVCNFTKPTKDKPSLLTLNEVLTLFHEFGHGLHGILTKSQYKSVSGTNVFWDFVELPSQIMENWVMEKECLDLFAKHYETGESIPDELITKIKLSNKFLQGMGTIRQMSFSSLDMQWHTIDPTSIKDVIEFENEKLNKFDLFPIEAAVNMSCSFGHIFAGGYSSGYYSYKWAEVLDADAFAYFKDKGIFNKEVATSFKENILEKGGSQDPMELYKIFRGQEPNPSALLERGGLL
ncbi:MAG: M3 family metallopeptidase [Halobacteriovoraceae bacterium]|jgi:peptidyl-dipeptidase Dcp|nr:M3 family metallopeptidase [Halobacteriovoraceae bacterium]